MSTDPVKLGRLFAEIVSGHDVTRFDEIVAPGYVNHNAFAMRSIDIWRVEDGRFVEHWDELNALDIFHPDRRRGAAWPTVMMQPIPAVGEMRTGPCR